MTLERVLGGAMFVAEGAGVALDSSEMLGLNVVCHCGVVRSLEGTEHARPTPIPLPHHVLLDHFS